jgi:hypothetical protein
MKSKIKNIKPNQNNPRVIRGNKFDKLVKSIKQFPQMLELRPIVVDEDMIILGGNMRFKACVEAGLKEVPIKIAKGLTEEQKKEFIIKDNVGFGEWDWDILANDWDEKKLEDWGLDVWVQDNLDQNESEEVERTKINDFPKCMICNQDLLIGGENEFDGFDEAYIIETNAECVNEDCDVSVVIYNTKYEQNRTH